ncbi:MAG: riboflavin synthase, alpha subunit, partial [Candidatus Parcubacteria bacterium]
MFSGIIQAKSTIRSVRHTGKGVDAVLVRPKRFSLKTGDSIAVDGICSTVVSFSKSTFQVRYMEETLKHTIASGYMQGQVINLEQSIRYGDRVHGHLVQGHVSSVGTVTSIQKVADAWNITIRLVLGERKYIVHKGSITINGVSLTIAKKTKDGCVVSIIPHTLKETTL